MGLFLQSWTSLGSQISVTAANNTSLLSFCPGFVCLWFVNIFKGYSGFLKVSKAS